MASFLFALLAAEGLVRLAAPQQLILLRPDIWQPTDTLGWVHRPNVSTTINTGERTVRVFTDGEGFRVGPEGRPPGHRKVLLLGDSFMAALQVEHEQSFAGLMEANLPARLGYPVEVWNTGVGGWGPSHYLLQLRSLLHRESFDLLIVAVYAGNDVEPERVDRFDPRQPVRRYRLKLPRRPTPEAIIEAILYPVNDFLELRSHAFVLAKEALSTVRMQLGLTADFFPTEFLRSEAAAPRWETTTRILGEISDLAESEGIPTIFILIPAPQQVDDEQLARYARGFGIDSTQLAMEQPSRLIGDPLRSAGLEVVDLLPAFREASLSGSPPLYGRIDNHLSPEGHETLYRLVEPVLQSRLGASARAGADRLTRSYLP